MAARVSRSFLHLASPREAKVRKKYGNASTVVDGITFDSKREADRYAELLMLTKASGPQQITDLRLQVRIPLTVGDVSLEGDTGRALCYVADFTYRDADGALHVEDAKGVRTKEYKLKKAILRAAGIEIEEV